MSDSTVPVADEPLLRGRLPLLVVPAIIILGLCFKCAPRKPLALGITEGPRSQLQRNLLAQVSFPLVHVIFSIGLYTTGGDRPPLTLDMSALEAVSGPGTPEARLLLFLIYLTSVVAFFSHIMFIVLYSQVSERQNVGPLMIVMGVLALLAFGWTTGSWLSFGRLWGEHTFMQEVEWMSLAQVFIVSFDALLGLALNRLQRVATPEKKLLLDRLASIVWLTFGMVMLVNSLKGPGLLLGLPFKGWVYYTLELAGILTTGHLHLVAFYLMCRAIEHHKESIVQLEVGEGNMLL